MSHLGRQQQQRPDSRSSNAGGGGGGRFTHALSAAIKREDFGRPPLPPTALGGQSRQHQPEEQLEEIEQKITLALQAIDANFDHCQRTMARDVMPKVERLAKLSNELLQASQPWLQFFMAVAAGDDDSGEAQGGIAGLGTVTHAEDIVGQAKDEEAVQMGAAKRAAAAEKAHLGDITARFPDDDDEDASADIDVDIDADIATPQLTSRYMTQEISGAGVGASGGRKRAGEAAAGVSARKRRNVRGTPVAMMRALVGGAVRAGVGFRGLRALYDLLLARGAEECAVDELMAASPELAAASPAAVAVLLDLLVRRRLARRVADGRWAARPPAASS
ncbi:DASH complex subunit ask1 [Coemansia sp. RSA 2320]|nr:DASH complex subunit ask1 [Coemansia sp. RSA 2320]